MSTCREVRERLGEAACRALDELVASAPPLSPQQYAELAVLLRRDPAIPPIRNPADAA